MHDFTTRDATAKDLASIVNIYNNVILKKTATARTQLITPQEESGWFRQMNEKKFPITVVEYNNKIIAWTSFDKVMDYSGFDKVAELLIFIDRNFRGRKIAHELVSICLKEAPKYDIETLLAFLYKHDNTVSIVSIFKKFGFKEWGNIPEIIKVGNIDYDLLILGTKIK